MKQIGFLILLFVAPVLWAHAVNAPVNLAERLEARARERIQTDVVTPKEKLLAQVSVSQAADAMPVLKELRMAKESIAKQMKFPKDLQDRNASGLIFGRLIAVMSEYERLRQQNLQAARVAGVLIAREEFISQDGKSFYIVAFIEQYVQSIRPPSYPADAAFPLIEEYNAWREHLLEDVASFQ